MIWFDLCVNYKNFVSIRWHITLLKCLCEQEIEIGNQLKREQQFSQNYNCLPWKAIYFTLEKQTVTRSVKPNSFIFIAIFIKSFWFNWNLFWNTVNVNWSLFQIDEHVKLIGKYNRICKSMKNKRELMKMKMNQYLSNQLSSNFFC